MQLANTPPLQSTTPGLHPVSFHQMAPPVRGNTHLITAYYLVYRPRKDERLSRPGWLVTYRNKVPPPGVEPGHVTHPSTNRARRRVTLLIRPTPLPLRHTAAASKRSARCRINIVDIYQRRRRAGKATASKLHGVVWTIDVCGTTFRRPMRWLYDSDFYSGVFPSRVVTLHHCERARQSPRITVQRP